MALLKTKDDDNKWVVVDVVARKEETQLKKATDTYARVIVGSELIDKIQKIGNSILGNLKLDKYYGLLVHADLKASVTKPRNRIAPLQKLASSRVLDRRA
jgi:hypothetical protein